jgi:hypothetical protein
MMAQFITPTTEQVKRWNTFVASRPPTIRRDLAKFNMWTLYTLLPKGKRIRTKRVTIFGFTEGAKGVRFLVGASSRFNVTPYDREFSYRGLVGPDELKECELPQPNETTDGIRAAEEEIGVFCNQLISELYPEFSSRALAA